jgi:hypothetical protein
MGKKVSMCLMNDGHIITMGLLHTTPIRLHGHSSGLLTNPSQLCGIVSNHQFDSILVRSRLTDHP